MSRRWSGPKRVGRLDAEQRGVPWRCLRCGRMVETDEDAADHRKLLALGANKCRKVAKATAKPKPMWRRGSRRWMERGPSVKPPNRSTWRAERHYAGVLVQYAVVSP